MRRLNWKIMGLFAGNPHDLQLMTNDPEDLIRKIRADPNYSHITNLEAVFVGDLRYIRSAGLNLPRGR